MSAKKRKEEIKLLETELQDAVSQITELLEQDSGNIYCTISYHNNVVRENKAMLKAIKLGLGSIGLHPVPPRQAVLANIYQHTSVCKKLRNLLHTGLEDRFSFSIRNTLPMLVDYTDPKGFFKFGPYIVKHHTWYRNFVHMQGDEWVVSEGGNDKKGLYYSQKGEKIYVVLFSTGDITPTSTTESDTEGDGDRGGGRRRGRSRSRSGRSPSPRRSRSRRRSRSSSRGESRRSRSRNRGGGSPGPSRRTTPNPKPSSSTKTPRRGGRGQGTNKKNTSSTPEEGVPASAVGSSHTIRQPPRGRGRLASLIAAAVDPPAVVFEGGLETLKGIRKRISKGSYRFKDISSSFKWLGGGKDDHNHFIVLFNNDVERKNFLNDFDTTTNVRVFLASFYGT